MKKLKVVSLISGGGSTMEALVKAAQAGELNGDETEVEIAGVISNTDEAGGLKKAEKLQIPSCVIERKLFADRESFGKMLLAVLEVMQADIVFQNGWLPVTPQNVIEAFQGRIFNQHPGAIDPEGEEGMDFGGIGMHGQAPTCARLAYAWATKEESPTTESTIHHLSADGKYDRGQIIKMETLRIGRFPIPGIEIEDMEGDTIIREMLLDSVERVQRLLLPIEHQNVQKVIRHIAEFGEVPKYTRQERLIPVERKEILVKAKALAVKLFPKG